MFIDVKEKCNPNHATWIDHEDVNCQMYIDKAYCYANGSAMAGSNLEYYRNLNFTAGSCPQCGCVGGKFKIVSNCIIHHHRYCDILNGFIICF